MCLHVNDGPANDGRFKEEGFQPSRLPGACGERRCELFLFFVPMLTFCSGILHLGLAFALANITLTYSLTSLLGRFLALPSYLPYSEPPSRVFPKSEFVFLGVVTHNWVSNYLLIFSSRC